MAALLDIYIKAETLKTLADTIAKKGEKGLSITVSVNDETNEWGQNVTSFVSQTKEQREAKKDRFYVGNGKVFWTDGIAKIAVKKEAAPTSDQAATGTEAPDDDLPF